MPAVRLVVGMFMESEYKWIASISIIGKVLRNVNKKHKLWKKN